VRITSILLALIFAMNLFSEEPQMANDSKKINFFKDETTKLQNPFELRDPFKRPAKSKRALRSATGKIIFQDSFSNIGTIEFVPIQKIRVVGIFLGPERRAIAKVSESAGNTEVKNDSKSIVEKTEKLSSESYILKEGMKLGNGDAEVKAILPGGVVLVEKIRNVYDQDEYLETILPIYGN